jgi:hypothetical protein
MRIGVGRHMQNYLDLDRVEAKDRSRSPVVSDAQIYDQELDLACLAEPLGFDSIWTTDHYFSPYQMTGSALQQATFLAGRTNRVDFGTMVITLPWHHLAGSDRDLRARSNAPRTTPHPRPRTRIVAEGV